MAPVGSEYRDGHGSVMVKVAEWPSVPGSKDNWALKQRAVWERANGRKLADDEVVLFCDHDQGNFDPRNLLALPRRYIGPMNSAAREHGGWHDRETAEACLALAMLAVGANDVERAAPRACGVCGREFVPRRSRTHGYNLATCEECLAQGKRARPYGAAECPVCGRGFERRSPSQRYCCRACWQRDYKDRKARGDAGGKG